MIRPALSVAALLCVAYAIFTGFALRDAKYAYIQRKHVRFTAHVAKGAAQTGVSTQPTIPDEIICRAGFRTNNKVLWQYQSERAPPLLDLLHAEDRAYAVFKLSGLHPPLPKIPWQKAKWAMLFHAAPLMNLTETRMQAQALAFDGHAHTLIVYSELPKLLMGGHAPELAVSVSIILHLEGEEIVNTTYAQVPLCLYPSTTEYYHLVGCTEILAETAHLVPEWVLYHHLQGFSHFYVYVEGNVSIVSNYLAPMVAAGLVTVVDFTWPQSSSKGFWSQQASQNSCILRSRGRSRWVALHDIDEFFQVMEPGNKTVAQFLRERSHLEYIAAFLTKSIWFGSSLNNSLQQEHDLAGKNLTIGQYNSRAAEALKTGREKLIVNPRSTSYISVHKMTTGGQVLVPNPVIELRLCHYKQPSQRRYPVADMSMAAQADAVHHLLTHFLPVG